MNHFLILPYIHKRNTKPRTTPMLYPIDEKLSTGALGYVDIRIPACDADKRTIIRLSVQNIEPGDSITFRSICPLDGSFEISATTNPVLDAPYMGYPETLITENANLTAAERTLNIPSTK